MTRRETLFNRYFGISLLALMLAAELFLRVAPGLGPGVFRGTYGNMLSMYLVIEDRLQTAGPNVTVLGLGDSLTMTQFQPVAFAETASLEAGTVFNAGFLGASFPAQENLLNAVGREHLSNLENVFFFVNPRRLSADEEPLNDAFRVAIPAADGSWREAWRTKRVAPLLDHSVLYGLSRHLSTSAWREWIGSQDSWDRFEYLQPLGGSDWRGERASLDAPSYPYPPIVAISPERVAEMRRVVGLLRGWGVEVSLLVSPIYPTLDAFASDTVRTEFDRVMREVARQTGSRYLPELSAGFAPPRDGDYCDYGHMNRSGGEAFSRRLARHGDTLLQRGTTSGDAG